ncbi:MAG: Asp23/Gls24 family envelope stress response protein [Eubacterium sp.]|jgi:uncharacterized alkaline shock family protein YloU|uniref:Asp23/Gls24 family envelope stress response protein n=1 Tax=Eubacterium sp. F2 TaxID=3381348 RepID=UPI003907F27C|nr:Asp23/Gls24 family envelope stress response protein [Eubacterium sp.]MCI2197172.1 Asp23/Gls24 family envelope stress response protein [Eubacterium sp.]
MTMMKATDLGLITVSNSVFAEIINSVMQSERCASNMWLSMHQGRLIRMVRVFRDPDYVRDLSVRLNEDGRICLTFGVIVKFGVSIRRETRHAADEICARIYEQTGMIPAEITINIDGVRTRSNKTARRSTKVVFRYAEDEWQRKSYS